MRYHLSLERPSSLFRAFGLETDPRTGLLGLTRMPGDAARLAYGPGPSVGVGPAPFAGVTDDAEGRVYVVDAGDGRIWRLTVDPRSLAAPRVGADLAAHREPWPPGPRPETRPAARDILAGPRGGLWVVERDADRVVHLDRVTGARLGELPGPIDRPGRLAADARGRIYLSDADGVSRFLHDGRPDPDWSAPARPGVAGDEPASIAFLPGVGLAVADGSLLVIHRLGGAPPTSFPLRLPGPGDLDPYEVRLDSAGNPLPRVEGLEATATALAAWDGRLWLGLRPVVGGPSRLYRLDVESRRLTRVTTVDESADVAGLGVARGEGPVEGRLLVHDAASRAVLALRAGAASHAHGVLLAGPFEAPAGLGRWYRLRAAGRCPEGGARFRFATLATAPDDSPGDVDALAAANPPPPPTWFLAPAHPGRPGPPAAKAAAGPAPPAGADAPPSDPPERHALTPAGTWRDGPDEAFDLRLWHEAADPRTPPRRLWVAAFFHGEGPDSPTLGTLRVESDHKGWEALLPAIYRRDAMTPALGTAAPDLTPPVEPTLLDGLLGLFEATAEVLDDRIDALPLWFDPDATGDPGGLARHLGFDPEGLDDGQVREALRGYWSAASLGATAEGLRRAAEAQAGVRLAVRDPGADASAWVLGEGPGLGAARTRLAPGPPAGAVLDRSAVLDASRLTGGDDRGASLWDEGLGRVVALVYAADLRDPAARRALDRCLRDRVPAHVSCVVAVIRGTARLGVQATLGLDAVLGPPRREPLALGDRIDAHRLAPDREPRPRPNRRVGQDTLA
jgi:hypothetical protein